MILVLAGNKDEFEKFLENHEPKNIFRFISNDSDYEGHKKCDLLRIGAYESNPLWKDVDKRKRLTEYCQSHGVDINDAYLCRLWRYFLTGTIITGASTNNVHTANIKRKPLGQLVGAFKNGVNQTNQSMT